MSRDALVAKVMEFVLNGTRKCKLNGLVYIPYINHHILKGIKHTY